MNANVAERNAEAFTETPLFEALARAGYVARGVVYALIGVLAIRLADGVAAPKPNQQGAMQQIAHQPFGHALLVLTAIGLGGYALWRFAQAFVGHTPEYGEHSKLDRIGAVGSGIAYAAFSILAISVLRGTGGNSSAKTKQTTAGVLQWPAGRELVAAAGLLFLGIAAYQAYLGLSKKFLTYSKTGQMSEGVLKALHVDRHRRPGRPGRRVRLDRPVRPQGGPRLHAQGCRRDRRCVAAPAPALVRDCGSHRRRLWARSPSAPTRSPTPAIARSDSGRRARTSTSGYPFAESREEYSWARVAVRSQVR